MIKPNASAIFRIRLEKPDQIIFDLDPHEKAPFAAVKLAAMDVRNRLKSYELQSFPRLTGGKGVHVVVPLKPQHSWDVTKRFAQRLAQDMQHDVPQAYIATMSKKKRDGKIFVDYFRNDYSSTAIVPFSLRARSGAAVAAPVTWKELDKIDSAAAFTLFDIKKKLNIRTGKMIEQFLSLRQTLKP